MVKTLKTRRGDTIIEILFALSIFSLVAILSVTVRNIGVSIAEANLELNMARNEVDAQAEAIRFIQNSYLVERELVDKPYEDLWEKIREVADKNDDTYPVPSLSDINSCETFLKENITHGFIVNTRKIAPESPKDTIKTNLNDNFEDEANNYIFPATLGARLIYNTEKKEGGEDSALNEDNGSDLVRSEGIIVIPIKSTDSKKTPQFYDFHIYTCWISPQNSRPTTTGTILRLYNPEFEEGAH